MAIVVCRAVRVGQGAHQGRQKVGIEKGAGFEMKAYHPADHRAAKISKRGTSILPQEMVRTAASPPYKGFYLLLKRYHPSTSSGSRQNRVH